MFGKLNLNSVTRKSILLEYVNWACADEVARARGFIKAYTVHLDLFFNSLFTLNIGIHGAKQTVYT